MSEPLVVCVLGMHRSGTSLATRLLDAVGVSLGPREQLLEPGACNPAGFWEHRPLMELNDAILAAFGGSWDAPPELEPGWEFDPRLDPIEARARSVLARDFAGADAWGWKDPRTCLTLAFWQRLVPGMRYLVCLRRPHEVALSLERRDGLPLARGLHLWCLYTRRALEGSDGRRRAFVCYEDLVEGSEEELRRLCELAGRAGLADDDAGRRRLLGLVDRGLRHHRAAPPAADRADPCARALGLAEGAYALLRSRRTASGAAVAGILAEALDLVEPVVRALRLEARERWAGAVHAASLELERLVPPGTDFVLVDQGEWGDAAGGSAVPFLERDGSYWGPPADDEAAIRELERLRAGGAEFVAFGWPAFWWLEYYAGFHDYLWERFERVHANERLVVFRLTPRRPRRRSTEET